MKLDIGIEEAARKEICEGLNRLLADTFTLYLKTHNYHWNVTGPLFHSLHGMFELQYTELFQAGDAVAERIRSLGFAAPGSYQQFSKLTSVKEATSEVQKAIEMVRQLVSGHECVAKTARSLFPVAEKAGDESTCDLLTQRLQVHEKTAWMLRSFLDE